MSYLQKELHGEIMAREIYKKYPRAEEICIINVEDDGQDFLDISITGFEHYAQPKMDRLEKFLKSSSIQYEKEIGCCEKVGSVKIPISVPQVIKIPEGIEKFEEFSNLYMVEGVITDTPNVEEIIGDIKHVSYDGGYPCLCAGWWELNIGEHKVFLKGLLRSNGDPGYDIFDSPMSGEWKILDVPGWLQKVVTKDELEKLANKHIPLGCCGGCV